MNKLLATTALLASVVVAAGSAHAASSSSSGQIKLTGSMPLICGVSVDTKNTTIDIQNGANKQVVAEITETCNDYQGYTISFTSANNGAMVQSDGGQSVDYTVNYDTASNASLKNALQLDRSTAAYGDKHDLAVTMPASNDRAAGTYSDTVTVQIAAR